MDNRDALLSYIEAVYKGVHGFVRSTEGNGIPNAIISVQGINHTVSSAADGDFWRLLVPGKYTITVSAKGYFSQTVNDVVVPADTGSVSYNFTLMRDNPEVWSAKNDFNLHENLASDRYLTNDELNKAMLDLQQLNPTVAEFQTSSNIAAVPVTSLKITHEVGSPEENKFHIALMGGLFASQPAGRELLIRFARHLVAGYTRQKPVISKMLSLAVIHIMPAIDGLFERITNPVCNPPSSPGEIGHQFLVPWKGSNGASDALKYAMKREQFDLILNIEGGGIYMSHPTVELDTMQEKVFKRLADRYVDNHSMMSASHNVNTCEHPVDSTDGIDSTDSKLMSMVYQQFGIPMITAHVSCCKYPPANSLLSLWKENMFSMNSFLGTVITGLRGHVEDINGEPMRNATVIIKGFQQPLRLTKNAAWFKALLPPGNYDIQVSCPEHTSKTVSVVVSDTGLTEVKVVLDKSTTEEEEYHSYSQIQKLLWHLNSEYPAISKLYSFKHSPMRNLSVLELGLQKRDMSFTGYPAIVFTAGLYRDEPVTTEVMLRFVHHLLSNYDTDNRIATFLKTLSVHVVLDANPDRPSNEKEVQTSENYSNFPVDKQSHTLEPETQALMNLLRNTEPVLTVNLRAGSLHVSIPYASDRASHNGNKFATPDEETFRFIASEYVMHHPTMANGHPNCSSHPRDTFEGGVTNAGSWKPYKGSMIDYSYLNTSTFQLDIFIDCCGSPDKSLLPTVWNQNKESLLAMMDAVHNGLTGYVIDEESQPIPNAQVRVEGTEHTVAGGTTGAYWRLLPPGQYTVEVSAYGYLSTTKLGACCVCLAIVVLGICCYTACQKRANRDRRQYYFSPLPHRLYQFEDDKKDIDIFNKPLTGIAGIPQPYYDEDESSGSEEDVVLINPKHRQWEPAPIDE
ncbi:hypothetical protein L9F63_006940 [Diploptera punctata]|uniref:Peptidase M14 domain-containing protein n=1 Tax=Diploptera punctata TaxID=6984 RepID=A0AAD8E4E3_DIPPU|nr:hypothetical protein L9F63_006940 [Diploptera punctata]